MLMPFVREFIKGPTPLHVIDAAKQGSGKGLLADCCSVVATGRDAGKGPELRDPAETRKFITSVLTAEIWEASMALTLPTHCAPPQEATNGRRESSDDDRFVP